MGLRDLPGIGGYTAAAIAAIAFSRRAIAIDGNIERVIARLHAIEAELPAAKTEIRACAETLVPHRRAGDFTQAMMDLGSTICTPKKPACGICPWMEPCVARARGDAETFPRKAPKVEGRLRYGASFVVTRADGHVLIRTRPEKGLLGSMTEVPSTGWTHELAEADALAQAPLKLKWRKLPGVVEHGFTHFPLRQTVYVAGAPAKNKSPRRYALGGARRTARRGIAKCHAEGCGPRRARRQAARGRSLIRIRKAPWDFASGCGCAPCCRAPIRRADRAGRRRSASPCRRG